MKVRVLHMENRVYNPFRFTQAIALAAVFATTAAFGGLERAAHHFALNESREQSFADAVAVTGEPVTVTLPDSPRAGIRFQVGASSESRMEVVWDSGRVVKFPISVQSQDGEYTADADGHRKGEPFIIGDSSVMVGSYRQYVRPLMKPYTVSKGTTSPMGFDYLAERDLLPGASNHVNDIVFEATPDGRRRIVWDGSYVYRLNPDRYEKKEDAKVSEIRFVFSKGARYAPKADDTAKIDGERFACLDFAANPRAKSFAAASLGDGLAAGMQTIRGVPVRLAKPLDSADIAICHEGGGHSGMSWNNYTGRDPAFGFGAAVHYRFPARPYVKAHLVFALDDAVDARGRPAKDRILRLRLSRYPWNGIGSNAISTQTLDWRGGVPEDAVQVGSVVRDGKAYPLYFATVGIDLNPILDMVSRRGFEQTGDGWVPGDYLDVDFCGKGDDVRVDARSDSAFNLFGATLESAPVSVDFRNAPGAPGNIFTQDERERYLTLVLRGERPNAGGRISWTAKDVLTGRTAFSSSTTFGPLPPGEEDARRIDLSAAKEPGVYEIAFSVTDSEGRPVFDVSTRFAVVVPSGRAADRFTSPYETWWFKGPHGTPSSWDVGGPLLWKAGIKKTNVSDWPTNAMEKYDITFTGFVLAPGQHEFDAETGKFKQHGALSGEEWFVTNVTRQIQSRPFVDHIMVWHESAPANEFPEELLGLPVPAATDADMAAAKYVNEIGRLVRWHFPSLRIQIGNSGKSFGAVTRPFRGGADPQYYDAIGIESGMASKFPEVPHVTGVQGLMVARECAEKYVGRPVPAAACYEFVGQVDGWIGELKQAQWYMRDALICLANRSTLVPVGGLSDSNGSYFDSVWGKVGLLRRAPYLEPKPAYVAFAALTKALDGVTLVRQLDTGSTTVYALLFRRADGRYATAIWCAAGEAEIAFDVPGGGEVMDMMGATRSLGIFGLFGKKAACGESPAYVITDKPVRGVKIARRWFPKAEAFAAGAREYRWFDDASSVSNAPDRRADSRIIEKTFRQLPFLVPSDDFTVKAADDAEKGCCIEVELDMKRHDVNPWFTEYTTLHLREPVVIEGPFERFGIWVKGNSNWGSVRFEIEDGNGVRFVGYLIHDVAWKGLEWGSEMWVNFDGWNILSCVLERDKGNAPWEYGGLAPGGRSDGHIHFPIKIRSITVDMNRRKLDLIDFKPTVPVIRLGPIVAK